MFALGLYANDTPVVYLRPPRIEDDLLFAMDSLVYSTVPKFKLRVALLTEGLTALVYSKGHYVLVILTDKQEIIGFFKELLFDFRAKSVPYEGQELIEELRPYGVRILEHLQKAFAYLPRRLCEEHKSIYRHLVAETGHEAFALVFDSNIWLFNRKGIIIAKGEFKFEDSFTLYSTRFMKKRPRGIIIQAEPRKIVPLALQAPLDHLAPQPQNVSGKAYRALFE